MKFNFKESPLYPMIIAVAGNIFKLTETQKDEEVAEEMKIAIEEALNYEGDITDGIKKVFDAVEWAIDLNPKLKGAAWIDVLFGLLESILIASFGRKKAKVHPLMEIIKAKIKANKELRKARRSEKKK